MKLILFGGAQIGKVNKELKLIEKAIKSFKPKQILHIPFARIVATEKEWRDGWFHRNISLKNITYLNAEKEKDIAKAKNPLVFISGGVNKTNLLNKIKSNQKLLKFIKNASCIVGESSGSAILGAYWRSDKKDKLVKGLNIVKNTVIEVHYSQKKRQKLLEREMKKAKAKYGIGIDETTAIEFNLSEFPKKYKKIGENIIEVKTK